VAKPYNRTDRIAEEIAHATSLFMQENLSEQWGIVSCPRVDITPDMRNATIWLSFYPPLENDETLEKIIRSHKNDLIEILKKRVPTKTIPHYTFAVDHGEESADKIYNLMDKI